MAPPKSSYWSPKPESGLKWYGFRDDGVYRVIIHDGWAWLYGRWNRFVWECNEDFLRAHFKRVKRAAHFKQTTKAKRKSK